MRFYQSFLLVVASSLSLQVHADTAHTFVNGIKFPNTADEGETAVEQSVLTPAPGQKLQGFTELLPYVLRAPDQDEAGSCMYMSLTGIVEWYMAKLHPELPRDPEGPLDLSERYIMNFSSRSETKLADWKTDSINLFNSARAVARNSSYRFTKGWYTQDDDGTYHRAQPTTKDASYGTAYNWIDESSGAVDLVRLPRFKREVLFADPASNQWNVGVMPDNIVDQIKTALQTNHAPVQVIYNHFGYWHATVIVGFDDDADNADCHFVRGFLTVMKQKGEEQGSKSKAGEAARKAQKAFDRGGGCHPRGVFYVRDSIYGDPSGPMYHYDLNSPKDDAPYSKQIIMLEYDWVRYLGNHAVQVLLK